MAYVALTCLISTIELEFLQSIPRVSLHDEAPIKSLFENLSCLRAFLEKNSSCGGAAIRDFALKVEDDIEIQLSNFLLAKDDTVHQEAASRELCQTFEKAQEKTDQVVEIIMSKGKGRQKTCEYCDYLIDLMRRIDGYLDKSLQSNTRVFYDQTPLESLSQNILSLRKFVQTSIFCGAPIKDLETKLRESVLKAKDDIEKFLLAKDDIVHQEAASQQIHQTLREAAENAAELFNTTPFKSLNEDLSCLRAFLEKNSSCGGAAIREFALKVEDDFEIQLSNFLLGRELCHTFEKAQEKTEQVVGIIMRKEKGRQKICEYCDYLIALMRRIDGYLDKSLQSNTRVFYDQTPLESLSQNLLSLRKFVQTSIFCGAAIKYLETKLREYVLKAKDDIEKQLDNVLLAKDDIVHQETASQQIHQTLREAAENAAELLLNTKAFKSLNKALEALFFPSSSFRASAIKDLETKKLKVEDDVKVQLISFLLSKDTMHQEEASHDLRQTLQKAEEKTAELVEIMNKEKQRHKTSEYFDDIRALMGRIESYLDEEEMFQSKTRVLYAEKPFKFLDEIFSFLKKFLETSSPCGAPITDLETKMREFLLKTKDDIQQQFHYFFVANRKLQVNISVGITKQLKASHLLNRKLHQTLHQATEKAAQLLNNTSKEAADDDEANDTQSMNVKSMTLCQTLQKAEEKTAQLVEIMSKEKERHKTCEYCDDLIALLQRIIDGYLDEKSFQSKIGVFYDETPFKSLNENISSLREFLQTSNLCGAPIKDLETKMREFVLKAKYDIQQQFHNFRVAIRKLQIKILVGKKKKREAFHLLNIKLLLTLQQATESASELLKNINNRSKEVDDDEANDTQSMNVMSGRMVGRQNDISMIKNQLFRRFFGVKVIPIIGMPGIGKTTLARKIFEDQSVASHFEVRKWFDVAQRYNESKMFPRWEKVGGYWKDKRYLIVLDDIGSTQQWYDLQELFPKCDNGSCILLTTRFYGVAEEACSIKGAYYHIMNFLDANESWDLFCSIFPLEKYRAPRYENFRSHLAIVVENCDGLPLTIVVVAKRLFECKNNIQHELKKIDKEIELLGIVDNTSLTLMYNQLPECLKVCFQYLGVFPKRSEIRVKTLVRLWIAEGFVKPSQNVELEEIAYCYLKGLIDRSFVLISRQTVDGKIKTCRVHSVMHNICFREAQKEGILCAVNTRQLPRWSLNAFANSCRWLSLCRHSFDYYVLFSLNNPRSILFFEEDPEIFVPLKLLRVLAFVPSPVLQRVPMPLGDLAFLRYLSVSQWFEGLSDVVSTNQNLQTLVVSGSESEPQLGTPTLHLPSTIWDSPQLRHLELGTCYTVDSPSVVKENLQTLSWVDPTHCRKEVYSSFPNIKKLKIFCKEDLEPNHIAGSSNKHIILGELDYLEQLESLTVSVSVGCIVTFPERCMFPLQLKKLKLSGTDLSEWDLTIIGMLKWLDVLELENAFNGKVWEVFEGGFYRLRFLVIKAKKLKQLKAYIGSFPCLEYLALRSCYCLKEIPASFGEIFTLKSIELDGQCHPSIVASAKRIQEKLWKNFAKENFQIKIPGPEYEESESVEDVGVGNFEKANSELKIDGAVYKPDEYTHTKESVEEDLINAGIRIRIGRIELCLIIMLFIYICYIYTIRSHNR